MSILLTNRLKEWIDVPAIIYTSNNQNLRGTLKWGINLPLVPSGTPIKEYSPEETDRVISERTRYWFVNIRENAPEMNQTDRIKLLTAHINNAGDIISGWADYFCALDVKNKGLVRYLLRKV